LEPVRLVEEKRRSERKRREIEGGFILGAGEVVRENYDSLEEAVVQGSGSEYSMNGE